MKIQRVKCDMCGKVYDDEPSNKNEYTIIKNGVTLVNDTCEDCSKKLDEFFNVNALFIGEINE